jgi:hypothetical protein
MPTPSAQPWCRSRGPPPHEARATTEAQRPAVHRKAGRAAGSPAAGATSRPMDHSHPQRRRHRAPTALSTTTTAAAALHGRSPNRWPERRRQHRPTTRKTQHRRPQPPPQRRCTGEAQPRSGRRSPTTDRRATAGQRPSTHERSRQPRTGHACASLGRSPAPGGTGTGSPGRRRNQRASTDTLDAIHAAAASTTAVSAGGGGDGRRTA